LGAHVSECCGGVPAPVTNRMSKLS
jgi:hypothetical protein